MAKRTLPELLAPADMPDPFERHWWNLMQVLAWVFLGNRTVVRNVGPQDTFESAFTMKDLGRNGAHYLRIADAEEAVIEALQAGRLTATGVLNGEGDRKEIPSLEWVDLVFRFEPYYFAGPKDFSRTVPYWKDLRFQSKDVLAVWPDPLESLAMAEPVGAALLTDTERDKLLKHIALLALALAARSSLYRRGESPNAKQIAEAVGAILDALPTANKRGAGASNIRESIRAGLELLNE